MTFDELKGYIVDNLCSVYPIMSNQGMKYILVLYDFDSNLVASRSIKSNKGVAVIDTYESIYAELTDTRIIYLSYNT